MFRCIQFGTHSRGFCCLTLLVLLLTATVGGGGAQEPLKQKEQPRILSGPSDDPLKIMSFNLRLATPADGDNRWELRKDLLVDTIKAFQPDLLGTQETLALQKEFLDAHLTGFQSIGVGRDDGQLKGEMTAIWFRNERFELIDAGHFWLSERPSEPGSVSWDSSLTRMATWVKLKERNQPESRPIFFLNTHFDHRGAEAREQSAKLIRQRLEKESSASDLIVAGDFNCGEGSAPYRILFDQTAEGKIGPSKIVWDSLRVHSPTPGEAEGTFNGFQVTSTNGPRIDWIGHSKSWKVARAGIDRTSRNDKLPSDHFPVFAEINR